jgi:2-octaprenylphenol hydroxylase
MKHYDVFDSVDVVIIGGGIVGLTLASLLAQQRSLRLALIEASPPSTILAEPSPLVSALNHASEALLQQTGVWSSLLPEASSYRRMQVWQAIGAGELTISSAALHLPYLGHILNNQTLHQALWQQAQQHPNIQLLASKRLQAIYRDETHARVILENGRVITAKLLIAQMVNTLGFVDSCRSHSLFMIMVSRRWWPPSKRSYLTNRRLISYSMRTASSPCCL